LPVGRFPRQRDQRGGKNEFDEEAHSLKRRWEMEDVGDGETLVVTGLSVIRKSIKQYLARDLKREWR
jgi:hypothetical protein